MYSGLIFFLLIWIVFSNPDPDLIDITL
jgi:hypothetical protein